MSKYIRYQPAISRNADQSNEEDHWLKRFENSLLKDAVQPKQDRSLYDQITSIMNGKGKYPTVEAAVEDMKNRSGLTAYLNKIKTSGDEIATTHKTAENKEKLLPAVIRKHPDVAHTVDNIIQSTKGNLPVLSVINQVRGIHKLDTNDANDWDCDDFTMYVSDLNLQERNKNKRHNEEHNLGKQDTGNASDLDQDNNDAFGFATPAAKIQ